MNEIIYLEPSEEITSVIDRLRAAESNSVSFVIPRGATIAQSIVNLKLLKRSATEMKKEISLIAADRISRNLASQIGLTVFSKVSEAEKHKSVSPKLTRAKSEEPKGDFKVNNYYQNKSEDEDEETTSQISDTDLSQIDQEPSEDKKPEQEPAEKNIHKDMLVSEEERDSKDEEEVEIKKRPIEDIPHNERIEQNDQRKNHSINNSIKPMKKSTRGARKKLLVFAGILAVLVIAASYILLPTSVVNIQIKTEDFSTEKDLDIDKNATENDAEKLIAKGKLLESEKEISKEFDATGKKDVGEKASGKVKVSNSLDTGSHTIAKGTKITSGSKSFVLENDVTVPAATPTLVNGTPGVSPGVSAEVTVIADQPGDAYNIGPTEFFIAGLPAKINAKSTVAMTGGVTKEVKVVTEEDVTKAAASVKDELSSFAKTDLEEIAKNEKMAIFENGIKSEVVSGSASKNPGDEADKFEYVVKVKSKTIAFIKNDLDQVLVGAAEKELGSDKMVVAPDKADIKYEVIDSNVDSGVLKVKASFVGKSGHKLDGESIKKKIKGKNVVAAGKSIEEDENVVDTEIKLKPGFINQVSYLVRNIKINFGYGE